MYDFNAVAIADFASRVLAFRNDLAVDFHRDAALRVAGFGEQVAQRAAGGAGAALSVQDDRVHRTSLVVSLADEKFQCWKKQRPDMPGADLELKLGQ
jgi:hypothetical protein